MQLFNYVLVFIVIFICVFCIIDRICSCFERCAAAKSFDRYLKSEDKNVAKVEDEDKTE